MVKIIIHCIIILLLLVSIGINVFFFTGNGDSERLNNLENTVDEVLRENRELRESVIRFETERDRLRSERDRLRSERAEINRRLNETAGDAKGILKDAIDTSERIRQNAEKLGDTK